MTTPGIGHNGGPRFDSLEEMILAAAEAVRPPERITVSEAAERYHIVKNPGQHEGPFSLEKTPYLREPQDVLSSLDFNAMIFAGPARTGKSAMLINWLCHTAITDPADMMVVHMAQHTARDWSQADLAKAIRNSDELRKRIVPGKSNDNVYDKRFLSGMRLTVTWPTIKNLSGKTIPRLWIMDMDRIKPQIIDGEGHVFDLTRKRADTFKRYGMCAAEASPGFPINDPKWSPSLEHPHEAPPAEGILALYNRGDRRRWYWQCPHCHESFQPRFNLLRWPKSNDIMECAEQAFLACPHCYESEGVPITFAMQPELNIAGRWVKEGQFWRNDGTIVGTPRRSDIASFWMFGPAAGFTEWKTLVQRFLVASEEFDRTGNDGSLMTTVTVDQGEGYIPKALEGGLLPETLKDRAEEWGGRDEQGDAYVPHGARFLIQAIDVQKDSFVHHVFGIGENFDIWHVDMFKTRKSKRSDDQGHPHRIDPAAHGEDWVAISEAMERTWPLSDGTGRRMGLKMTVCDSGGRDGVTRNAYEFYHALRERGQHKRFHLLAGRPSKTEMSTVRLTHIENWTGTKRLAGAVGAIPLWLVNSNIVKDTARNMMTRAEPGGMVHFPNWAPMWLYSQLTNEYRKPDGTWHNPNSKRNESFDLLAYCIAFCDHSDIRIRFLDWTNPPGWAAPWDRNDLVYDPNQKIINEAPKKPQRTLADIAADVA